MTHAVAPTRAGLVRPKLDQICADAVDLARDAVTEDVAGAYIEAIAEGERLVTHYFECAMTGYRGWRWAVTVARTSRSKQVTICETVLLPGPDALTTPDWVPWNERVQPGDLGIGDLMPTAADDDRLVPGYLLSEDPAVDDVVWELGLGRVRVMSRDGRIDAAERWYEGDHGPQAPIALAAPANARCVSCGFFLPLAGSMRALFGACANLYAPDDGRVVSGDHGCGAHSEVLIEQVIEVDEAPTIYDDAEVEPVAVAASVEAVGDIESIDEIVATSTIEIIPESVSTEGATDVAAVEAATDVAAPIEAATDVAGAESESASVQAAGDAEATTETVLVEGDGDFGSFEIVAENVPFESIVEVATVEDLAETAAVDFARAQPDGSVDESDTAETNAGPVDAASSDVIDQPDAFEFDAADRFEPAVEGEVQTFGDEPEAAMVEPEAVTSGNEHDAAMVEPEAVTFADDHDAAVIESEVAAVEPEATTFEPETVTVRGEPEAATVEDEPEAVAFEPEAVTVRDEPGVATFEDEPEAVALEPEVVTFEDEPEATMVEDGRVAEADVLAASGDDEAAAEFTETETEPAAGDDLSVDDALVEAPEPAVAEVAQSAPLDFEPAADDADDLAAVVVEPAGGELIEPTMVEPAGGELPEPVAAETGPSATLGRAPDAESPDAELPDAGTPEAEMQVAESSDAETPVFESPGAEASSEDAPVAESSDIETPSAFDLGSEVPVVDEHEATETLVATETYEDPATVEALAEPHALEFPDDDDADDDEHPEAPQAFDLGSDVSPTENDVSPTENPETI